VSAIARYASACSGVVYSLSAIVSPLIHYFVFPPTVEHYHGSPKQFGLAGILGLVGLVCLMLLPNQNEETNSAG
jgi:hypothetical protein